MAEDIRLRVGRRLREFLELTGHSIASVASKSGISSSYLYRLKKGKENPTIDKLDLIATACNSNLGEFFSTWSREKTPEEIESENAAATAIVQKLLTDPLTREGVLAAVMTWGRPNRGVRKSRSRKK